MAQIGTIQLQSQNNGVVDVPIFETGDSSSEVYEFLRIQTGSGIGFIPVTNTNDATYSFLRVQTQNNGVVAVTDTAGSAIPDSVVTQYRYEDDLDTTVAVDSVGSNDANLPSGSSYDTTSRCGSLALSLDGSDEAVSQSTVDLYNSGDAGASVAGFFNPATANGDEYSILGFEGDSNNWFGIQQRAVNDNNIWARMQVDGTTVSVDSGVAVSASSYQHAVAAVDGSTLYIFVDGTLENQTSHSLDPSNIGAGSYILGNLIEGGGLPLDGLLDNSSFATARLTESEAQALVDQC